MSLQRWKDKLRPGSFRGVRFFVDNVQYSSGRRGPDHEFPDREEPYAADTGRKQRKFNIDAFIVGIDYFPAKNLLIKALEKKGPADLIHPYYGKKKVVCRSFTVEEFAAAGGYVKFTINFVEAGTLVFPKTNADRPFLVDLAGKVLGEGAASALESGMQIADQAQFVLDSATEKVLGITEQMDSISAGMAGAADPLAEFAYSLRNIRASAADLILSPLVLARNFQDAFALLLSAVAPSDGFRFSRSFFGFGLLDPLIPLTTATRIIQAGSLGALNTFTQTLGLIGGSSAGTRLSFNSYDDAISVRDILTGHADFLMGTSGDDVFSSLVNLRTQVVGAIPDESRNLSHVTSFIPFTTSSSLVTAYELYGSVDQEQDIINRNHIGHPGFLVGGNPLEVLDG